MLAGVVSKINQRFPRNGFSRNILVMMTGTSMAQAISIGMAPILTRLYTPEDYGIFALYSSTCSIISVISTGRYDTAIMLPESDDEAINLLALSFSITASISIILTLGIAFFQQPIARLIGSQKIVPLLYFIPVTVFLTGSYHGLYYWSSRRQRFKNLSTGKVIGALAGSATNLGMGIYGAGVSGLIIGAVSNQTALSAILNWQLWGEDRDKISAVSRNRIALMAQRYYKFPIFSLPSSFFNVVAQQVPIFLLNKFFGTFVVGFFSLTQRVLSIPLTLISSSILDVFMQRATNDFVINGNCRRIFLKTLYYLFFISIVPFILFLILSPLLFKVIFGDKWMVAGEYAQLLAPLFWFRFISSPLSYVIYIAEKQHVDLFGQVMLFVFSILSMIVGYFYNSPKISIVCYSLLYMLVYIYYILLSYKYSASS